MKAFLPLLAALLAGGCAALNQLPADMASHSRWPSERRPGSYAIERLPSQQDAAASQQILEAAARPALEAAGFTPAADASTADVSVLLGAQVTTAERFGDGDPFVWHGLHGGPGLWGHRAFIGPGGYHGIGGWRAGSSLGARVAPTSRSLHQVIVLIRDRRSGTVLYETTASSQTFSPASAAVLPALFTAAMSRFPAASAGPVRVTLPTPRAIPPSPSPSPLPSPLPAPAPGGAP